MTDYCVCGHHSHDHRSDPTGSGNTDCYSSLDGNVDDYGYPINRCPCTEYQPVTA